MKTSLLLVYFEAVVKVTTEKFITVNACVSVRFSPSRPLLISLGSLFSGSSLFLLQSFLFFTGLIFTRTKSRKVSDCNKTRKRLVLIYPFNFICFHFSLGTCGTHFGLAQYHQHPAGGSIDLLPILCVEQQK